MNKTRMAITTAPWIGVAAILLAVAVPVTAQRSPLAEPEIRWQSEGDMLLRERALLTYQAVSVRELDLEAAMEMIDRLANTSQITFAASDVQEVENRMIFTSREDPSAVFDVDSANGTILFHAGWAKYTEVEPTPGLPAAEEALELARKYLAELEMLPAKEAELVVDHVGGVGMAASRDGKTSEAFDKLVTVFFRRVIDDLPVRGRGSRILVHLGEKGALAGLIRNWSEVVAERVPRENLKDEDRLRREIRTRLLRMAGGADLIDVETTELVLFDDGRGVLEPAIYVVAKAHYPGPEGAERPVEIPVDFYVPVLQKTAAYYPFHQDAEARWPGSERRN